MKQINKEVADIKLTTSEFRIFLTKAIAKGWKKLVKQNNDAIIASWEGTGLNLHTTGQQDEKWRNKMVQKFAGIDKAKEWNKQSYEYAKMRFYSKAYNPSSGIKDTFQTQNIPPHPNQPNSKLYPPKVLKPPSLKKQNKTTTRVRLKPSIYSLVETPPDIYVSNKKGTLYEYFDVDNDNTDNDDDEQHNNNINTNDEDNCNNLNFNFNDDDNGDNNNVETPVSFNSMRYRLVGLQNVYSANCYALSWIQQFCAIPQFTKAISLYLNPNDYLRSETNAMSEYLYKIQIKLLHNLYQLCNKINNPSTITQEDVFCHDPKKQIIALKTKHFIDLLPPPFNGHAQQDVDEFHMKMLSIIHNVIDNSNNNCNEYHQECTIDRLFGYVVQTHMQCHQCSESRCTTDPLNLTFKIGIPNTNKFIRLPQLIKNEFDEEMLQSQCNKCDKHGLIKPQHTKRISMLQFPLYWVMSLKMFDDKSHKIKVCVKTPFSMQVTNRTYILLSAIIHQGVTANSGHYYQIGRSLDDCQKAWKRKNRSIPNWFQYGTWVKSDDSRKMRITLERVKKLLNITKQRRSVNGWVDAPYLLIYVKFENQGISNVPLPSDMPNIIMSQSKQNDNDKDKDKDNDDDDDDDIEVAKFLNDDNDDDDIDIEVQMSNGNDNNHLQQDANQHDDEDIDIEVQMSNGNNNNHLQHDVNQYDEDIDIDIDKRLTGNEENSDENQNNEEDVDINLDVEVENETHATESTGLTQNFYGIQLNLPSLNVTFD